jgi:intein/homing endonuclease
MIKSNSDFVHIHAHTEFSRFDGGQSVSEFVGTARTMGFKSLAITDHGTVGGWVKFHQECKKVKLDAKGNPIPTIKPILGIEAYMARNHKLAGKEYQPDGKAGNRHLVLLAKNQKGYENICSMSQAAYIDGFYQSPRIDFNLLAEHSEGVICTSACISGVINANLLHDRYDEAKRCAKIFKDIFKNDFFLEIMYHGYDSERIIIPDVFKLSKELDIPVIASNDCFVSGTMIATDVGVRSIDSLECGNKVVTHKNRLRTVEFVNKQTVQETVQIKTVLGTIAMETTSNHPVLTVSKVKSKFSTPEWKKTGELTPSDYLLLHKNPIDLFAKNDLEYIDLTEILGDSFNKYIENNEYVTRQGFGGREGKIAIPLKLPITDDFLFVIGRYIAEGSIDTSSTQVSFAAHIKESELQHRIENYFKNFGINSYCPVKGNDGKLVFSSKIWQSILSKLCNYGAENKMMPKINNSYFCWSKNQIIKILSAYISGDGHISAKINSASVVCASTSSLLAFEISDIFSRLGFVALPTVRNKFAKHKNPKANTFNWLPLYVLHMSFVDIERFFALTGEKKPIYDKPKPKYNRRKMIDIGEYYAVKFKSLTKIKGNKDVFNIQVEEDESYVANSYIVHNCHYCRKDQAKSQEILMAISSSKCIKDPKCYRHPYDELYMKSAAEMNKVFGTHPEVLLNTVAISERVEDYLKTGGMRLPVFDVEQGKKDAIKLGVDEKTKKEFEKIHTPYKFLESLAWNGMRKLHWDKSEPHVAALKKELNDVQIAWSANRMDFATYFLVVWDIINFARREKILTGPGRGSGAGSVMLRTLGITYGIDPVKYSLLWERFLGFDEIFYISDDDWGFDATESGIVLDEDTPEDDLDEARATEDDLGGVDRYG